MKIHYLLLRNAPMHTTLTKNRKLQECGYLKMWFTFACKTMAVYMPKRITTKNLYLTQPSHILKYCKGLSNKILLKVHFVSIIRSIQIDCIQWYRKLFMESFYYPTI